MSLNKNRVYITLGNAWADHINEVPPGAIALGVAHLGDDGPPGALILYKDRNQGREDGFAFSFSLASHGYYPAILVTRKVLAALRPFAEQAIERAPMLAPHLVAQDDAAAESAAQEADGDAQPPGGIKNKMSRPSTEGRRINVFLDAESIALAEQLGAGNISEGIRLALLQAALPHKHDDA